jgi:Zn finger protein HypA/HybF involved in hydrogenase expression
MHDTFLLKRISESLSDLIEKNRIDRVIKLQITTSKNSHIHKDNLYEQLLLDHNGVVGQWTEIIIDRQDIESLTAVIESIEGENLELMQ